MDNKNEKISITIGDWILEKSDLICNQEKAIQYSVKKLQKVNETTIVVLECEYGEIKYELKDIEELFTKPLPIRK